MRSTHFLIGLAAWALFESLSISAAAKPEQAISFNRDVLPILSDYCFPCHGPDEKTRKSGLRLDTREDLFSTKDSQALVSPGRPADSLLIKKILEPNPEDRMPPPEAKTPLTASQIEMLQTWIEQGANWERHWAFIPPRKSGLPEVRQNGWPRNPIDFFILARLESEGLKPSLQADRATLIRRASLDLTGLPPDSSAVNSFIQDPDPNAYEKVVDRLLGSERYGERMALAWMDAARYGDSSVFHADGPRYMWPWRDWVIRAYNENKPFNEFTVEQLAGDLLHNASRDQQVASGFNRNHGTTDEGGAIDEEYRVEYVVDRVKTTANVWLGLSMECAQCHDHKYDPVSQKEYYQFYAYFNNTTDAGMQTRNGNADPKIYLFTPEQESANNRLLREWTAAKDNRKNGKPDSEELKSWMREYADMNEFQFPAADAWHELGPFQADNAQQAFDKNFGPEGERSVDLAKEHQKLKWTEKPDYADGESIELNVPANASSYLYRALHAGKPTLLKISLGSNDSVKAWLNGSEVHSNFTSRVLEPDQDTVVLNLKSGTNHLLLKISNGSNAAGFYFKMAGPGIPDEIQTLVQIPPANLTEEQEGKLSDYYSKNLWPKGLALDEKIQSLQKERDALLNASVTSMIMQDRKDRRPTYVLNRGHYASPIEDEEIFPGVPKALPPLPGGAPANRLGLANWLVDDDHPLTARVAVNRYWAMLFGEGLSTTVSDFGTRGEWPSHPELLDWLARDFIDHGWNVKRTLKQIVMSAAYRQSSAASPELLRKDPENRLLARAPRIRLQGEFIRDNALALSGLLDRRVGGPSVNPYQPPKIWNEVSLDGNLFYQRDEGRKLYRRSMYTYWKRSAPMPSMTAFDAPTREKCVIQRQRTNTPLQALVTLNDEQFVEAARRFAQRILRLGGANFSERLDWAFIQATSRPADETRQRVFGDLFESQLSKYQSQPEQAEALLDVGEYPRDTALDAPEHAAWTLVASAILNLDEVITRE